MQNGLIKTNEFHIYKCKITQYKGDLNTKEITLPLKSVRFGESIGFDNSVFCEMKHDLDCFPTGMAVETINIHSKIKEVGTGVFRDLKKLQRICVSKENSILYDNDGVLFAFYDGWDPIALEKIPNAGKSLVCYPQGRKQQEYNIPDGTTFIDEGAFYNCKKLKKNNDS